MTTRTVAVTGAGGLVGTPLCQALRNDGWTVIRLTRGAADSAPDTTLHWDTQQGLTDPERLDGIDAVVHLAGENIATGRWTTAKKQRIRESRVIGTETLCRQLANLRRPPATMICASAIGYYGNRGDEQLDESSRVGEGFLAEVCRDWETASQPATDAGIRVVNLRIGVVLSNEGGALHSMLLPYRLSLSLLMGGVVGNGRQYMSWIARDELVDVIRHALEHSELRGPVNATSPNPMTNAQFTRTLGRVLHRPPLLPMPAFAARLAFGEMADDLLLGSARIFPIRLQQSGYKFRFAELDAALRNELNRS